MKKLDEIEYIKEQPTYAPGPNGPVYQGMQKRVYKGTVKSISSGARFGHHLLDIVIISLIQNGINELGTIWLVAQGNISHADYQFYDAMGIVIWIISVFGGLLYYFLMEMLFQQTLGKMATQSVVVDEYGNKPTAWQFFLRTICRWVPFEPFSCLGTPSRGWHDTWSKTYVIRKADLAVMKRKLEEQTEEDAAIYESMITDESLNI